MTEPLEMTAETEATTPNHQDRLDDRLEPRVRMLEELARGQARQLSMLVTNDERRIAIDQQNAVVISRLADALGNVEKGMADNRSLILEKVDDKFRLLTANMDGVSTRLTGCEASLTAHGDTIKEHSRFIRGLGWGLASAWALFTGTLLAVLNHWIGHWK